LRAHSRNLGTLKASQLKAFNTERCCLKPQERHAESQLRAVTRLRRYFKASADVGGWTAHVIEAIAGMVLSYERHIEATVVVFNV
jgi:hypothetical protein